MIDVFEEINLLHNEIEEEMDILNNLMKYSSEVLETSYVNEVDYQNQDLCLDYISFTEYSIMISKNLKQILRKSQQEIEDYKQKIKMLKLLLNHLLNEVARLSTIQGGIKMDCPPVHIRMGRQFCRPIFVSKPSAKE